METKYPILKRPKRKLCYFSDKDRPPKQWTEMMSLGDIDRMFDDLEPSDHEEDVALPSSPLLHIDDTETNQSDMAPSPIQQHERHSSEESHKVNRINVSTSPKGCSSHDSPSPGKDIDLDRQGPVKTSSPIEERKVVDVGVSNNKDGALSPILFLCDDDGEEAKLQPFHSPKCIRPEKILSSKKVVAHKPEEATVKTKAGDVHRQPMVKRPRQVDKSMFTFLQKLRDTQAAPSSSRKPVSPVQAATVPEEDFFILEDEGPLLFRIPRTMSSSKRHNRTCGTVFDSQTSKGSPGNPSEAVEKEQEKLQSPVINEQKKNTKEKKTKKTEIPEPPESQPEELCPPVDRAAVGRLAHEKPIKKQSRVKQVCSEKNDTKDVKPQDTAVEATTDLEERSRKMTKKSKKNMEVKKPKAVKHREEVDEKKTRIKMGRKEAQVLKEMPHIEAGIEDNHDEHDGQADDPALLSEKTTKGKQNKLPVVLEKSSSAESRISGKRQRRPPGQWWMSSTLDIEGWDVTECQPTATKHKLSHTESKQSRAKRKKDEDLERLNEKKPVQSSSQTTNQAREKMTKQNKREGQVRAKPRKTKVSQKVFVETDTEQVEMQQQQELLDCDPPNSSPLLPSHRHHSSSSGNQMLQRVDHNSSAKNASTPAEKSRKQLGERDADKRRRKTPCDWWVVGNQVEEVSPRPGKPVKGRKKVKPNKALGLGSPKNGNVAVSSKPQGGAPGPSHKVKPVSSKEAVKRSPPTTVKTPSKASRKVSGLSGEEEVTERRDCSPHRTPEAQDASEANRVWGCQNHRNHSDNMSKVIRSGPSSMIQLEDYQDNDMTLPSSRFNTVLCASDLCAPPLEPLVLQPKDKDNLSEWFGSLWSVESGADITPDQFDWYFYQGRAFGIHVELNCGTFCSGKMLLGSYMKKPLWVDHSAVTIFHLLTSSVNVVIDGSVSLFNPAQAFAVPCGHAYSIQNVSAQPAVLYFTRMFSESSD